MKQWNTVAIVGVGLIGGSIGLALRQRNLAKTVIGIGRRQAALRAARRVGAVTHTTVDLAKGVAEAELVVVCTPPHRIVEHVRQAALACPEGTLLTDVAGVKRSIVEALDADLPRGCRFLGGHPIAGAEKSGPLHASAELFEGRAAVLTPTKNTRAEDFDLLEQFWQSLGSVVVSMTPEEHDRVLALTSHLPHAVAAALMLTTPESCFRFSGPGLRDATRIAAGDVELWRQIMSVNRDNLTAAIDQYAANLAALRAAIDDGNQEGLSRLLTAAKRNRDALGS